MKNLFICSMFALLIVICFISPALAGTVAAYAGIIFVMYNCATFAFFEKKRVGWQRCIYGFIFIFIFSGALLDLFKSCNNMSKTESPNASVQLNQDIDDLQPRTILIGTDGELYSVPNKNVQKALQSGYYEHFREMVRDDGAIVAIPDSKVQVALLTGKYHYRNDSI